MRMSISTTSGSSGPELSVIGFGDAESGHELREALSGEAELCGSAAAMAAAAHQRRADEPLLERPPRLLEPPTVRRFCDRELRRQRRRRHDAALRTPHRERGQHVLQLAHVSRPVIARERRDRRRIQRRAAAHPRRRVAPEMLGQHGDVLATVAQRRYRHPNHVEAVQQIEAKSSRRHILP